MNTIDKKESFWDKCKSFMRGIGNEFPSFLKENVIIIVLLLFYIVFYRLWESLIGDNLINKLLCHFESNRVSDCLFIVGVLVCFFLCYHNRKKQIDRKTFFLCLIAISFWVFYRFVHRRCGLHETAYYLYLTPLSFTKHIKYVDIVPLMAICTLVSPLIGKLINCFKEGINKNREEKVDGFIRDYPIDGSEDILGRKEVAHHAMARLLATDTTDGSFTLGIDAPWGSGKTSFMNMMKELVDSEEDNKYDNAIIIDFNPWLFSKDKDLVTVFMGELNKNLRYYNVSLAKHFLDYSKLLSTFDTDDITYIASLIDFVHNDRTIKKKKQQIRDAIIQIPKKIVVFVDDLDRLDANKIIEMMKLISIRTDFPNMYFVASYDKNYLIQCLNTVIPSKGAALVSKVFQHEFRLPAPSPDVMTSIVLNDYLHPVLTETDQISLSSFLSEEKDDNYLPLISNLREAKRFANSFCSNYAYNKTDKAYSKNQIISLYLLELFRVKYPSVFSFFESNWERMIIEKKTEDNQKSYCVLYDESSNSSNINFIEHLQDKDNRKNLDMTIEDQSITEHILSLLFGKNGYIDCIDFLRHYFNPTID